MSNPILIIDPGHGGRDAGGGSNTYFREKNMVLEISKYQAERFRQLGVAVALTRTSDETIEPGPRTKIVRDSGAKYCISNHINAGGGRGVETIHSIYNDGKLATSICNAIASEGMPKRRVFTRALPSDPKRDYYFMHRDTGGVTTIIIEYGFADNPEDTARLQEHWRVYAEAVVRAFCAYIDHPYGAPAAEPKPGAVKELPVIQREVTGTIDGNPGPAGYLINGTTYLPARAIVEEMGGRITGDGRSYQITKELK